MLIHLKNKLYRFLRWSERYTKTDMVYVGTSGFWLGVGQGVATASSFLLSVLFANYVSKELFGVYKYVLSVAGTVSAFSLTGMNTVVARAVAQGFDGTFKYSIRLQLWWTLPQFLLTAVVALYYFAQGNNMFAFTFLLVAIFGPLSNVANTFTVFLQGKKDFRTSTIYTACSAVIHLAALSAVVLFLPSLIWLVATYYGTITFANIYLCYRTIKKYPPASQVLREEDVSYAKHLSLMNVVNTLANQADSLLVYHLLGPAQLAIYAFSIILPDRVRTILSGLSNAVLPKLAEQRGGTKESLTRKMVQLGTVSIFMILAYVIAAPYLFAVLFPAYTSSVFYSQLYALTLLMLPSFVTMPALYAQRREKALYVLNIAVPLIKIGLSFISIMLFGILGAILARIVYYLVYMGVAAYYVRTDLDTNDA